MIDTSGTEDRYRYRYVALLSALVVIGLWLRIRNLGHLSLIVDEGVQALAVEAVLKHGIPRMESGALYLRGPLYLYLQAGLASLFELNEFWLRFPGVLFGTAAIVPAYILGKDLFNRPVGVLSAAIIMLSTWEIEMSRYARVYIVFQFFFLIALIFFYRGFVVDEYRAKIWFLVVAFFAFLTHELSQVLGTLFLIPILMPAFGWRKKVKIGGWAVGLGGLLFVTRQFNDIYLPDTLSWASDGGEAASGIMNQITAALGVRPINGPDLSHFSYAVQHDFAAVLTLSLVAVGTTTYLLYRLSQNGEAGKIALGLLVVWPGVAYQFGVVLIFLVAYLVLFARGSRILTDRTFLASMGTALVSFIGWFVLLLSSPNLVLIQIPLVTFGFPAFYDYLLWWLIRGWPVMTVFLAAGSIWLFIRCLRNRHERKALFLLGALYVPALFTSLFESSYDVEYTLHLYPLVVLIALALFWKISALALKYFGLSNVVSRHALLVLVIPVFLVISQDANPVSAWKVSERTYQSEKPRYRNVMASRFYYDYHPDIKGVSNYVEERKSEGDKVLIFSPNHVVQLVDFYVGGVDFWITTEEKKTNRSVIQGGELIHYTSACKYLTKHSELERLVNSSSGSIWIIGDYRTLKKSNGWFPVPKIKQKVKSVAKSPDHIGRDGVTFVKRIP